MNAQSSESHDVEGFRYRGGYFAESFVHPGWTVGIEKNIWSDLKNKYNDKRVNHKRRKKVVLKEFYWGASFWGYNHPNSEFLLALSGDVGYQRSSSRGSIWCAEFGLGTGRYFYNIPTYELEEFIDKTSYRKVPLAGRWVFNPSLSLFWGWNAWLRKDRHWSFKIGPSIYSRIPYNHTSVLSGGITAKVILHDIFKK